jgi:sarcosine oxidase
VFEGSRASCDLHGLQYEILTSAEITRRWPAYQLPAETLAVFQPEGGFLVPEACIVAHADAARSHGAEIHSGERVLDWESHGDGVVVRTDRATYEADRLVLTAGAWMATLVEELGRLAIPERQVLGWFDPRRPDLFMPDRLPVFNLLVDEGRYYGLPIFGAPGFKVGRYHHLGQQVTADTVDRDCHPEDEAILRSFVERYFPEAAGPTVALKTCMFTNSPDEHFIIDLHPRYPQVSVAAGFSGHGYKFCSVVGEILADLTEHGSTQHDISLFRLSRLSVKPV